MMKGQAEYSSVEVLDVRLDPSAKTNADRLQADPTVRSVKSVARSDSGFIPSPTSESSQIPLSKADSGYSSNVSLRSLKAASKPPVPEKDFARSMAEKQQSLKSPRRDSFYIAELQLPSPTIITTEIDPPIPAAPEREAPPAPSSAKRPWPDFSPAPQHIFDG